MAASDDLSDHPAEDAVESAEIGGGDDDEEDRDRGRLDERVAVGPLDFLELRPAGSEEAEDAGALPLGGRLLLALGELLALAPLAVLALAPFRFLRFLGLFTALGAGR